MQWMDGVLSKGEKAEFFHDEFRCPVYVKDVVSIIQALTSRWVSGIIYSIKAKVLVI
jgi:dTDP-4-dehydrorhamnose reductase